MIDHKSRRGFLRTAAGICGAVGMTTSAGALQVAARGKVVGRDEFSRAAFDEYARRFNLRDYDGVLQFWAKDFLISFGGYTLKGRNEMLAFYRFFHDHVHESLHVDEFVSNKNRVFLEARVQLKGKKELSPAKLSEAGFGRLVAPPVGKTVEIPQFIHYRVDEDGKFTTVVCVICDEPRLV